jgi:hypothetical protein
MRHERTALRITAGRRSWENFWARATGAIFAVGIFASVYSDRAAAFADDHYVLTYYLALEVGFTPRQAYQIASATYAVDFDPHTDPMIGWTWGDVLFSSDVGLAQRSKRHWWEWSTINDAALNKWQNFHAFANSLWVRRCFLGTREEAEEDLAAAVFAVSPSNADGLIDAWGRVASLGLHNMRDIRGLPPEQATSLMQKFRITFCSGDDIQNVKNDRSKRSDDLRKLGMEQRNPGVLMHFTQDVFAHYLFSTEFGHAVAGHEPDFLSFNPARAHKAADATIKELTKFRDAMGTFLPEGPSNTASASDYLQQIVHDPDSDRVTRIVDALIKANPQPASFNLLAEPDLGAAIAVVNKAFGSWPGWSDWNASWGPFGRLTVTVPSHWMNYTYTQDGRIVNSEAAVEKVTLKFGKPVIETADGPDKDLIKIIVHESYTISNLADISVPGGNAGFEFAPAIPVIETSTFRDRIDSVVYLPGTEITETTALKDLKAARSGMSNGYGEAEGAAAEGEHEAVVDGGVEVNGLDAELRISVNRRNGTYVTGAEIVTSRDELATGKITWQLSVQLYGYQPKLGPIVPLKGDTKPAQPDEIATQVWYLNCRNQGTEPWTKAYGGNIQLAFDKTTLRTQMALVDAYNIQEQDLENGTPASASCPGLFAFAKGQSCPLGIKRKLLDKPANDVPFIKALQTNGPLLACNAARGTDVKFRADIRKFCYTGNGQEKCDDTASVGSAYCPQNPMSPAALASLCARLGSNACFNNAVNNASNDVIVDYGEGIIFYSYTGDIKVDKATAGGDTIRGRGPLSAGITGDRSITGLDKVDCQGEWLYNMLQ